jgi:signal transduction histidine kinase
MKMPVWPDDTIARRFAVTQVLTIAATVGLSGLFYAFGGVWSSQPLEQTGLLNEVADIVRIIDAVPQEERDSLSAAASTKVFKVNWYPASSPASDILNDTKGQIGERITKQFSDGTHRIVTFGRDSPTPLPREIAYGRSESPATYALAVQFGDKSWLVFTEFARNWGLPLWAGIAVRLMFLIISILVVSTLAARQVAKPVKQFAEAVRRFGRNAQAPPLAEVGPREIRNVIATFNAMQTQIQTFVAYRTMMLAAISHDLRTPLTRIRLRGEYIDDPEQQARLFRDVDEMQTMVDGALAFFRDDAASEATTVFDLPRLMMTIANDYADQNIDIPYVGPAHAPYSGRPFALKRAFANIIENAVKYGTPPEIRLTRTDEAITITIRDSGPGIPPHHIESVFRPYYRVDKSRNRATGGVGLGLTAAQAIVHGHGGEIILENRAQRGLDVRIILPTLRS